ncbi:diphthamide biosynthesis protein [Trametopsis cervina]|nr:diphthamide biosynthesis protein [Trametopsis cervina]
MPDPTTTLYASGEEVIGRTINVEQVDIPTLSRKEDFEDYYDILRTVDEITKGDYKKIALQFPDELLHDSVPVFRLLKSRLGSERELYVLADTSYGSCCVDEVAAQHVDADAMVHYGHACMSQTSRLPVIYVFGKRSIDVQGCVSQLSDHIQAADPHPQHVWLRFDVRYAYIADSILEELQRRLTTCTIHLHSVPTFTRPQGIEPSEPHPQPSPAEISYDTILYVGGESLSLTNLLITNAFCQVYSYDPQTKSSKLESARSNKLLMRRYAAVQKARDADVFGILVGTLGVASYLPLISRLRSLLSRAHKKSYTITVGKLNPAKLGNFMEIECFVLVACPENSLIEAKDFLRPIVTPFELEISLQPTPTWTGRYELDFAKVALETEDRPSQRDANSTEDSTEEDEDRPTFSLVTGAYRQAKKYGLAIEQSEETIDSDPLAIVLRNRNTAVSVLPDSAAAEFLHSRTYRGLETRLGEDAPSVLEQGRSGIARGYEDDHR